MDGVARGRENLVLGGLGVEAENIDDLLGELFREPGLNHRNHRGITGDYDVANAFFAHDAIEGVDGIAGVLLVRILDAALIARLRPAADFDALHLLARDLGVGQLFAETEDEDAGGVGVGDQGGVARVLVVEAREVVEVRLVVDVEAVFVDGRAELHRFEEAIGAGAGEQGEAVGGRLEIVFEILADAGGVAREAVDFGRAGGEGAGAGGELPSEESGEAVAAVAVGLGVEVEADDWQGSRLKIEEPLELSFEVVTGTNGRLSGHAGREGMRRTFARFYTARVTRAPIYGYLLSLPERVVRSLAAVSGGLLREIGNVALPASVRRTSLYRTMVDVTLRFLIQEVGEVEGVYPTEGRLAEDFLLQRGASHGVELLGILAFHASPVWVLAALADAAGGSRTLIHEIADALKGEGLLDPEGGFDTMEQVLEGLEKTSGHLASTLNLPPVNVRGLREEWERLKEGLRSIPPKKVPTLETVEGVWERLRESARRQDRSVFAVSSLIAVSTVAHLPENVVWLSRAARSAARRTGKVLGAAILDHYTEALNEMSRTGFLAYWKREFRPYLRSAAEQFAPQHRSWTERLLEKRAAGRE